MTKHSMSMYRNTNDMFAAMQREIDVKAARIALLQEALSDLLSWFPEKPSDPEWRIRGGELGADEAVEAARSAIAGGNDAS